MIHPIKYLLAIGVSALVLSLFYPFLVIFQLDSPVRASWWIKDTIVYKDFIAKSINSRKIIIASGSNSLFGINSKTIEKDTGLKVLNLAESADLELEFYYFRVRKHYNPGDVVVLPLEFKFYESDQGYTEWFVVNMLAWGYEDFLIELPVYRRIKFYYHTPFQRTWLGLTRRWSQKKRTEVSKIVYEVNKLNNDRENTTWRGYSYTSLNSLGDINVVGKPTDNVRNAIKVGYPYLKDFEISDDFVEFYNKMRQLVEDTGGTLILTWPLTLQNKKYNLTNDSHRLRALNFRAALRENEIEIYCNPADSNMEIKYFFNTIKHLNIDGAVIRSKRLAACLKELM